MKIVIRKPSINEYKDLASLYLQFDEYNRSQDPTKKVESEKVYLKLAKADISTNQRLFILQNLILKTLQLDTYLSLQLSR